MTHAVKIKGTDCKIKYFSVRIFMFGKKLGGFVQVPANRREQKTAGMRSFIKKITKKTAYSANLCCMD